MEEVNITELEARHYLDLFSRCDIEKTGKVPVLKATEMFRSADVPNDILKHVRFSFLFFHLFFCPSFTIFHLFFVCCLHIDVKYGK